MLRIERKFVCYYYFVGWSNFSLGFHLSTYCPNIELHLPFGFIRIGWVIDFPDLPCNEDNLSLVKSKTYGLDYSK